MKRKKLIRKLDDLSGRFMIILDTAHGTMYLATREQLVDRLDVVFSEARKGFDECVALMKLLEQKDDS